MAMDRLPPEIAAQVATAAEDADLALFEECRALVSVVVDAEAKFNRIANVLRRLGYGTEDWPFPYMDATWGTWSMTGPDDLTEFWEQGPAPAKEIRRKGGSRKRCAELGAASGWTCYYCAKPGNREKGPDSRNWHVDHVYPVSEGGDDEIDNLVLACATCNLAKKDRLMRDFLSERRPRVVSIEEAAG